MNQYPQWLRGLESPIFARLYLAQTINLIGDALTWLGLALLAFELGGPVGAGAILAGALTLRVTAFVFLSPLAGAIADRVDRKRLMITTHLARMGIVCLLPFVTQVWQMYIIVLMLNVFYAFFTPTYTATIPLVTTTDTHRQAIALSSATYQLLGVLGPGVAGGLAAWLGNRSIFFLDGATFLVAALIIMTLPGQIMVNPGQAARTVGHTLQDIRTGTFCLFADPLIRYALALQLVASIAGAQILVNTVNQVQGILQLGKAEYSWVMAALGLGATLAAVGLGNAAKKLPQTLYISWGAALVTLALLPANLASLGGLMLLWTAAGVGQTLVNVSTQTLVADRVAVEVQGRVYGAHFAWSHLWWIFSYPLAGWLGKTLPTNNFYYSSLGGLALLIGIHWALAPKGQASPDGYWHEHGHTHDHSHKHDHHGNEVSQQSHNHLHFHRRPLIILGE
jgi:MFS transporter, NRE family, putaive nickel resistance protein